MNYLKQRYYNYLRDHNFYKYAEKVGVKLGENVRFTGQPGLGSEPYLIEIGNHVLIASHVTFITHEGGHWVLKGIDKKYNDTFGYGRIIVKDNVYIGSGATILRGVTIGENTIIGAGSLVNRSCEPNSVYAGVPAKRICSLEEWGKRFLDDMPEFDLENYKKNKKEEVLRIVDGFSKR